MDQKSQSGEVDGIILLNMSNLIDGRLYGSLHLGLCHQAILLTNLSEGRYDVEVALYQS